MINMDIRKYKKFIMPLFKLNIIKYSKTFLRLRDKYFLEDIYKYADEKVYLDCIANWYKNTHRSCKKSRKEIADQLYKRSNKKKDSRKVIFVVNSITPRTYKIIYALYKRKVDITILFCPRIDMTDATKILYKRLQMVCNSYYECRCFEQIMFEIIHSDAKIVHYFTRAEDLVYPYLLIRMKQLFSKIVIDRYDIYNGLYIEKPKEIYEKEKYIIENADGICNRSFELPYLRENLSFDIKGKELVLLDYISEVAEEINGNDLSKTELSLVYAGGVAVEKEWGREGVPWACFLEFANICKENNCHFHVYPSIWNVERLDQYIAMEKKNSYFHLHMPVEADRLIYELARYDYACLPTHRMEQKKEYYGYNTKYKYIYSASNKYFDAIAAGVPIIGAIPNILVKMLTESGICIPWAIEEYDFDKLRYKKKELRARVKEQRANWHIDNHIDELISFYQSLSGTIILKD